MTSRIPYQLETRVISYQFLEGDTTSTTNVPIRIDFPVDEIRVTRFSVDYDMYSPHNTGTVPLTAILQSDICGSLRPISVSSYRSFISTASDVDGGGTTNLHGFQTLALPCVPTRFIFPRNSQRSISGTYQFNIAGIQANADPTKRESYTDILGLKNMYVQLEFIQYDPVPDWQRYKEFLSFVQRQQDDSSFRLDSTRKPPSVGGIEPPPNAAKRRK